MMIRRPFPTDLTDRQWLFVRSRIPPPRRQRRRVEMRELVNAMRYRVHHECAWRALPAELPAWQTVHEYFRRWQSDGTWAAIERALTEAGDLLTAAVEPACRIGLPDHRPAALHVECSGHGASLPAVVA